MTKKPPTSKDAAEKVVKNIRRKTRQTYSAEEKIRIVLAGLRGEESISVLCGLFTVTFRPLSSFRQPLFKGQEVFTT